MQKTNKKPLFDACPCGSGAGFNACCGPYLGGLQNPSTAEALMRSRYTAYVRGDADYLLRTWHPDTRPPDLDFDPDICWLDLRVLASSNGGDDAQTGTVHFRARYKVQGKAARLEENSRFQRIHGKWFYVAGDIVAKPTHGGGQKRRGPKR
ncbi:MAG: hypothetical protein GY862_10530 [Gammaproteobacteria bacterium]|nr:hypothetical protein [Gammaproteobacteria bacterium]